MKQLLFLSALFVFTTSAIQAQNGTATSTASTEATPADEAAVKKVIADETTAFFAKNREQWASLWVHEPYISWTANGSPGQILTQTGWDAYSGMFDGYFKDPATGPAPVFVRNNFRVSVLGNVATVTFLQTRTPVGGIASVSWEVRLLEKQGADWKLAYVYSRMVD